MPYRLAMAQCFATFLSFGKLPASVPQSRCIFSDTVRPFRVERKIAGYKPGATYRITLGAYSVVVASSYYSL